MPFLHRTLTLTGVAQRLSQVYASGGANADPSMQDDICYRQILLMADPANAAVVYIGGSTVSSTSHGFSLDPTQASQGPVSLGPFETGPLKLSEIWVLGTNDERLMVGLVPF
jgi:hypothetical protein